MSQLLAALAELVGYTALVATSPKQSPASVSAPVAALVFFLMGAVIGGPIALSLPEVPGAVVVGLVLVVLVLFLALLKYLGIPVGAASSPKVSLAYGVAFYFGSFLSLLLLAGSAQS